MGNNLISWLTQNISDKLNEELANSEDGLNSKFLNTSFEFRIVTDTAEYKDADRALNNVKYYIHGLTTVVGSEKEGLGDDNLSVSVALRTDFLIPLINTSEEGVSTIVSECRNIVDNAFAASTGGTETIGDTVYYIAASHNVSQPGIRDVRPKVGDSITLSVTSSYYFVAQGISSDGITLEINGEKMFTRRIGICRKLVSEGVIPSDASGATKNIVSGTVLCISFDTPLRFGEFYKVVRAYSLFGQIIPMTVTLTMPKGTNETESAENVGTYTMIISDCGVNGELNLAASADYTLIEFYGDAEQGGS